MQWLDRWYAMERRFPLLWPILTAFVAAVIIMHLMILFVSWGDRWNPATWEGFSRFLWLICVGIITGILTAVRLSNRKGF